MAVIDQTTEYDEFVTEFYDHVVPYRERPDVAFYSELARQSAGPVLEIGCGTGRVLIPVARSGKGIWGIDSSEQMLAKCRDNLSTEPERTRRNVLGLRQDDMRYFRLPLTFDLITMPFRTFQHLITVGDQQECLTNIQHHLNAGGLFAFDMMNPSLEHLVDDRYLSEFNEEPDILTDDGRTVRRRFRIRARDLANQFIDAEIIYYVTHPDGSVIRLVHSFPFRYVFRYEAEHLLARCGLSVEAVYSDFDKSPFGSVYPGELVIVARKL